MKKNLFIALASFAIASSSMGAVTITLSGNPNNGAQLFTAAGAAGSIVADGNLIRIGTFTSQPAADSTFATLASSFHEFARTTTGRDSGAANIGRPNRANIAGSADAGTSPDPDSFFVGKSIYIWVYNAAASSDSVAQGIFLSTSGLVFEDAASATSVSGTTFTVGIGTGGQGWTPTTTELAAGAATRLNLSAPVPEPSASLLAGLLVSLGLIRRRR